MNTIRLTLEVLEDRFLLSSEAIPGVSLLAQPGGITNTNVVGYTPAQIRHAYGFDQIPTLQTNGYNTAGQGQIIAIVDAYDDPNIASDLHVFDSQFGIPDPTFIKVNQNGQTGPSPAVDSSWAGEISLDVEWAHAIAPAATILLVEAKSTNLNDMMAAVDTARNWPGVSVVSMSWGYSEGPTELGYDYHMTTPAGHTPITFTAATLDNGARFGLYWPAASPNVLAVGGTTLANSDSNYGTEKGWSSSTGGVSGYESQPSWQSLLVTNAKRTDPDVSYQADNSSKGFAVYDTVPYNRQTGWFNAGGDSAGAPQWAALVAIADQVRGSALDGPTQTLPALYNLAKQNYGQYFHDISTGSNGKYSAGPGYDLVTGIGSPKADQLVTALASWTGAAASVVSTTGTASTANLGATTAAVLEQSVPNEAAVPILSTLGMTSTANVSATGAVRERSVATDDFVANLPAFVGQIPPPREASVATSERQVRAGHPEVAVAASEWPQWRGWDVAALSHTVILNSENSDEDSWSDEDS